MNIIEDLSHSSFSEILKIHVDNYFQCNLEEIFSGDYSIFFSKLKILQDNFYH